MRNIRKNHDSAFKAKIALEAVKGEKTIAQLSSGYEVHADQIQRWKKQLLAELPAIFSDKKRAEKAGEELEAEFYR